VFENRFLTRLFGPKGSEVQGSRENCIINSGFYFHLQVRRLSSCYIVRPTVMEQDNNCSYGPNRLEVSSESIDLKMEIRV
jgi:hypothetical protein